jgi:hypothetical protein
MSDVQEEILKELKKLNANSERIFRNLFSDEVPHNIYQEEAVDWNANGSLNTIHHGKPLNLNNQLNDLNSSIDINCSRLHEINTNLKYLRDSLFGTDGGLRKIEKNLGDKISELLQFHKDEQTKKVMDQWKGRK